MPNQSCNPLHGLIPENFVRAGLHPAQVIEPIGSENGEALSIHAEQRRIIAFDKANDTEI
jgi:hypothetical protein